MISSLKIFPLVGIVSTFLDASVMGNRNKYQAASWAHFLLLFFCYFSNQTFDLFLLTVSTGINILVLSIDQNGASKRHFL